jgi:beta-N-acetylhexosaminidase
MKRKLLLGFIALVVYTSFIYNINYDTYTNQILTKGGREAPDFLSKKTPWADSVLKTLSDEERIAQLFMVAAYSNKDAAHTQALSDLITQQHIGGLIFFQGGPVRQAIILNELQAKSKVPMMIGMDAEWGLSMRLDSTVGYPRQMTLGALSNDSLIYQMGKDIAKQCKRLGVHVNFAPVVDVNNNPNNPVINSRSFGEVKENVSMKSMAYMKGLQSERVMANAKHFPGHGDTDVDSHLDLPVITHDKFRLDSLELFPFKQLIQNGLSSVMVAHLSIPKLDSAPNRASTLSPYIVDTLLKQNLGFEGLVFTDALNMKGVSKYFEPGMVDVEALVAGNDVLLFAENVPLAIQKIKEAIATGRITQAEIDRRCHKILKAKEWVGLNKYKPIVLENLYQDLNPLSATIRYKQMVENSITLVKNNPAIIPIPRSRNRVAIVTIGGHKEEAFIQQCEKYRKIDIYELDVKLTSQEVNIIPNRLKDYDRVVVALHGMSQRPRSNFGIDRLTQAFIKNLSDKVPTALILFGNPYGLQQFDRLPNLGSAIVAYQDNEITQTAVAKAIFGGLPFAGRLPVSAANFKAGTGIQTNKIQLGYSTPEEQGINSVKLAKIDSLLNAGLAESAYPGCQILVLRNGQIIYDKNIGHQTYERSKKIEANDVYDLASLTKIFASTMAMMKLSEQGLLSLDDKLGDYYDLPDTSDYNNITFKEMLSHQAGLVGWIPFYLHAIETEELYGTWFNRKKNKQFQRKIADNLYSAKFARDSIFHMILKQEIDEKKEYKYSDVGYYFLKEVIEKISKKTLNQYCEDNFYSPMDLPTMGYFPRDKIALRDIVPTEQDDVFRKQLVHGYVHDPGAAMLGGVGGHAGLFSNAYDAAYMMQCFLNGGNIGGKHYLNASTISTFTKCQFCESGDNRRGAGFDKPVMDGSPGPTCDCVSPNSFGHSGFTGTLVWADPDEQIVYVFLSNRIHPVADNIKLLTMNLRTEIQQLIYDAIEVRYTPKVQLSNKG